jgi:uncharacterized protein (DUF58 family)
VSRTSAAVAPAAATTPGVPLASPEVLRRLQLTVTRRLDGMLQGDHQGLVPGHGSEPGETRPYEPGDDVRRIDWNVTARSADTHIRQTIADRELEVTLVVDASPSLAYGTALRTKQELALSAAAAVGFLSARGGNRIGARILVPGGRVVAVPHRPGRDALMALLHRIAATPLVDGTRVDLADGLAQVATGQRRRGLVVVISDFLDAGDWPRPLRALAHRHELLAAHLLDPRELELPGMGVVSLTDPATGRTRSVALTPAVRQRFAAAAAAQQAEIAARLRRSGAGHLVLRTDRDWLVDVARFLAERRRRVDPRPGRPRG